MAAVLPLFSGSASGSAPLDESVAIVSASPAIRPEPTARPKRLDEQLPRGRLIELGGARGRTTLAVSTVIRAQRTDEPVVWIQFDTGALYPPDLAESGVDLDALVVVQVPRRSGPEGIARAAELLLRSGAFGLVVIDLSAGAPRGEAWQGRLSGLARKHDVQVVLLTASEESAPSLGAMVGMRIVPHRTRTAPGRYLIEHTILKDKTGAVREAAPDRHRAPWGLF